jgi:hypothetical protein
MKLLVITERGRVVGTQRVTPPNANAPAIAVLWRRPRQKVHEIGGGCRRKNCFGYERHDAFHRRIAASLRPKKATRKKKAARRWIGSVMPNP